MSYEGRATGGGAEDRLREAALGLAAAPFRPHPLLANGHAQTIARWAWPLSYRAYPDEVRLFEVEPGVRLLARCRWHEDRADRVTVIPVSYTHLTLPTTPYV